MRQFILVLLLVINSQILLAYNPINDGRLSELLQEFKYVPTVHVSTLPKAGCTAETFEYTTTYPQRETALNIKAKAFIPVTQNSPVIFMLPPLGGMNQLDQNLAEVFCRKNIAAILITTNLTGMDSDTLVPVVDHDHTHRRVVSAIKGGIIGIQSLNKINIAKIGLFGTSLGGILGSVAYGVMPEISAATLLVNGGDIPFILAHSDQPSIIKVMKARMKEQDLKTTQEYEQYLRQNLTLDPLHFAKLIDAESTKLFLSKADNSVPSEKQMEYYKAIGSPKETLFYNMPHMNTIFTVLGASDTRNKIADWFLIRFARPNPRQSLMY